MPNANRTQTVYCDTGNPDTFNASSLHRPGELGTAFDYNDRAYQVVQVDSGATASTPTGAVAANQLAYWKDKDKYLVTNDARVAIGGNTANAFRNQAAGWFRTANTAGYYAMILQRGDWIPCKAAAGGGIGQTIIADSTSAQVNFEGVGGNNQYKKLGVAREATGATADNTVYADVDVTNIP